ncbi:zinc finger protein 862-like [Platichthys flesus]|uniref:zinc finger protein 862-like n=1 Tax=Platichthys flesus TaxID=8260 RepID=UPI002DBC0C10|nr:zinc finger protein 862-like [Platichthys flesus]
MEHEAIIGGFKCLYWLVKHEIAHHTNYPALLDLADLLGCEYFSKLRIDQRTNYRSHKIVDDMLQILAEVVDEPISAAIKTSKAVGLEIDESTDISVLKQLDIHVRYTDKEGQLFCQFLDLVSIPDGMARTIAEAVKEVIIEKGIPQDRIYGLGTDGAAVMTGKHNGTAKLLADTWPGLVTVHCAAHRLALACKDAADGVPYMKTFRKHLQDLYLYFRNSANRTSALKAAASVLQVAALKEVKDTRWLSQEKAISNLQRNLPAVLATLAEEADLKKDPVARGLYTYCATYRFVAAVHLQADILPHLARLSKLFQKENVNFMAIKNHVPVTIETLRQIKAAGDKQPEGSFLAQVNEKVNNLNIDAEEERVRRDRGQPTSTGRFWTKFQNEVMDPYIDRLVEHLELRFQQVSILGAFNALGPPGPQADEGQAISDLKMLAKQFQVIQEMPLLHEWQSFKVLVTTGILKDKSQLEIMKAMTSQYDELHQLYPNLSLLSAIALTIPVASVNCERDFSAMNRIKTDLRNRLQGKSLTACMKISINGPPVSKFNFSRALELFFAQPRRIACTDASCQLCRKSEDPERNCK